MVTVDIISDQANRRVKKDIEKNDLDANIIEGLNREEIVEFIDNSHSNYILFLDKKDSISNSLLDKLCSVAKGGIDKSIISPNFNRRLQINGKLIPTFWLQQYLLHNKILRYDSTDMYPFLYESPEIKCNSVSFCQNRYIKFEEAHKNLLTSIQKLEELQKLLQAKQIYNEKEFKSIYLDELIFRYKQYRNSSSFLFKPIHANENILEILYAIINVKFGDVKEFGFKMKIDEDPNLQFDFEIIDDNAVKEIINKLDVKTKMLVLNKVLK